jgi:nucleotide-binding universal stress UspA family protein
MKKILVLTDFSEVSRYALAFAHSFFGDTIVDFHLLCVHPPEPGIQPVAEATCDDQLRDVVLALRREATNDWHTFRSSSSPGNLVKVVGQAVEVAVYDFVVIGANKDGASKLFGRSATTLIRGLKANVLVVPVDTPSRPVRQLVLAADFANLKNSKLLGPVKELVLLKGATLTLLTIDTPDKDAVQLEREAHIRQFLLPVEPTVTRLKAFEAKLGIDAYLTEHPVDLLVTIPQHKGGTDALTGSRITHSLAHTPPVPLLRLYDDGSNDLPEQVDDLSTANHAH